jgi:molecular chaperone GrpE
MTDENETTETTAQRRDPLDDPRYEVKWRKKESSTAPASQATVAGNTTPAAAGESETVEDLRRELAKERERVKELQERWQRSAADLVNLRRRTEQERGEVEQFASMLLVAELLPVLDNFERALATIPGNLAMLTWIQGVMLIERHLRSLLEQRGLAPIEAMGQPFSPHNHEAVGEREQADVAPGTVVQEYQKGYTMHGRVLRPALVEIATPPVRQSEPAAAEGPQAADTDTADAEDIAADTENENTGP